MKIMGKAKGILVLRISPLRPHVASENEIQNLLNQDFLLNITYKGQQLIGKLKNKW